MTVEVVATTQEKVTAGDTLSRMSSSDSSRSDLGPFSALRSFDDADPRELAGEGWDSDAEATATLNPATRR